jgi:hypothetical protein
MRTFKSNSAEATGAVILASVHPELARRYIQGRTDAEQGEITVATVMWVSMTALMAAALGVLIWNKIKAKEATIDLNTPVGG